MQQHPIAFGQVFWLFELVANGFAVFVLSPLLNTFNVNVYVVENCSVVLFM